MGFSVGLSLRLRFLVVGVFGVGDAEGMLVSAMLGMGAFGDVEVFGSAVAVEVGSVWVAVGAILRAWRACARSGFLCRSVGAPEVS